MIQNKLKINDSKTEFLVLTSSFLMQHFNDLNITVGNSRIAPSPSARNLGVIFDNHMCLDKQINSIRKSAFFHLRNIGSIRNMLTDDACSQLIHSLVTVRIDYCNSLLYGIPDSTLFRVQSVLNTAARILKKIWVPHITDILKDLHWLPIRQRITFKILLLTYQAYHNTAPDYLCELITPYCSARNLRSKDMMLVLPCHPGPRLKTYGERCFQFAGPKEWNYLPLLIRESPSIYIFKPPLKTYLFNCAFN